MIDRSPRLTRGSLLCVAAFLVTSAGCGGDSPSGPASYAGVDGRYTIQGQYTDPIARNTRFSGQVTLTQRTPSSSELTGTASVTLYNGNTVVETFNEVFAAERVGETGVRFALVNNTRISGVWEFVGTVNGRDVTGTQYLDYYVIPSTGSITVIDGAWSGRR